MACSLRKKALSLMRGSSPVKMAGRAFPETAALTKLRGGLRDVRDPRSTIQLPSSAGPFAA